MSSYVIWGREITNGAVALAGMKGYAEDWRLLEGAPLAGSFPAEARFDFNPEYPNDVTLTDFLYNLDHQIVASTKLRALLEGANVPCMEYLPVGVFDHKGVAVPEPYVIAHPLSPVECLDEAASGARRSRIDPDTIDKVKALVIDESRVDPSRLLFRPKAYHRVTLAHRSLVEKIDAAGITGVRWIELAKWPE